MKDVVDCEKRGGVVKQAVIPRYPNGETQRASARYLYLNT